MPDMMYALVLQVVDISADVAGVSASQLTDAQLEKACSAPEAQVDIVLLKGCRRLRDMSCLASLEQIQVLDVSGCNISTAATLSASIVKLM